MDSERTIRCEIEVNAPIGSVWEAWTTVEGITGFLAPACRIDLRVDGPYEIYFNPDAEPGKRGAEDMRILAIEAPTMLSFTWSAPPHLPNVRKQRTHVVIRLEEPEGIPERFSLSPNFPNPFNPTTTFTYAIPKDDYIQPKLSDFVRRSAPIC